MTKEKFQTALDGVKQLASDLLLPAICALGATLWEYHKSDTGLNASLGRPVFDQLSAYFLKLFYWGAFFAYGLRALKVVRDRRNHASVIEKQEAVLTRMQSIATDLEGHATGGSGHCFVWNVRHNGSFITSLEISVVGTFAMQDVSLGINSMAAAKRLFQQTQSTGDTRYIFQCEHTFSLPFVRPNQILSVSCNIPLQGPTSRYMLRWSARNGIWTQKVEVDATLASHRTMKTVVYSHDNTKIADPAGTELETPEWHIHVV